MRRPGNDRVNKDMKAIGAIDDAVRGATLGFTHG
jgi:hypothetical protein